jgi:hypothetical protein
MKKPSKEATALAVNALMSYKGFLLQECIKYEQENNAEKSVPMMAASMAITEVVDYLNQE